MATTAEKQAILRRARETVLSNVKGMDALDRDALDAWRALKKARQEDEPPPAASAAEPAPVDWERWQAWIDSHVAAHVNAAIEKERNWWLDELMPELVAHIQQESSIELSQDVRRLNCELAELRASLGELRALMAADRAARGIAGPAIDVPKPATPVN
jgi:hypothetical protein